MIRLLENHQLGYVTHAFVSCKSDELELLPNEVIVFSKENTGGWTYGFYMGRTGWLPLSYVQNIDENFLSKKSSTTYLNRSSPDSYDYSIQSLTRNEKDFIKDFKQKFGTICTDFTSKTLCSKIDSSLILMLCERFIRIYENFTGLLEKEAKFHKNLT
uniref:Rho guanine nucleotide exchange factor 6 (Trinotate prediction) n=1 Tax=Henneguya salminicola TaxID=69463 RepID=A0A6G3MIK4_HENSL